MEKQRKGCSSFLEIVVRFEIANSKGRNLRCQFHERSPFVFVENQSCKNSTVGRENKCNQFAKFISLDNLNLS